MRSAAVHVLGVCAAAVLLVSCAGATGGGEAPAAEATTGATSQATSEAAASEAATPDSQSAARAPAVTEAAAVESAPAPPTEDERAGVRSRTVVERGNGATTVVPGTQAAPGDGEERTVRVEVEGGLDVDGQAFAKFVLDTLNDPRSWSHDGLTFSRTDGDADVVVVLASPETSARMCEPLVTHGRLSCREGPRAILTMYRWVNGMEDYGDDLTGYRHYLVNHEVGHVLGHGHESCPAPGEPAPVMQQQTKDVDPCVPNSWPYP